MGVLRRARGRRRELGGWVGGWLGGGLPRLVKASLNDDRLRYLMTVITRHVTLRATCLIALTESNEKQRGTHTQDETGKLGKTR